MRSIFKLYLYFVLFHCHKAAAGIETVGEISGSDLTLCVSSITSVAVPSVSTLEKLSVQQLVKQSEIITTTKQMVIAAIRVVIIFALHSSSVSLSCIKSPSIMVFLLRPLFLANKSRTFS